MSWILSTHFDMRQRVSLNFLDRNKRSKLKRSYHETSITAIINALHPSNFVFFLVFFY